MAMSEWFLVGIGIIVMSVITAFFIGKTRESAKVNKLIETLNQSVSSQTITNFVDLIPYQNFHHLFLVISGMF